MAEQNKTRYLVRFRAFDRESKKLYTWDMYDNYPLKGINVTAPQESTGLCDKYLKDIFLGDILNYKEENYLMRFRCGSYILWNLESVIPKFIWAHDIFDEFHEIEIVGNTFQNFEYIIDCLNKQNEFEIGLTNE